MTLSSWQSRECDYKCSNDFEGVTASRISH